MTGKPIDARFSRDDIKPCAVCSKPIMTDNPLGLFWRVSAERLMINRQAAMREHGLEMTMSGNVALARAFSPNSSLAHQIEAPRSFLICEPCALHKCGNLPAALLPES